MNAHPKPYSRVTSPSKLDDTFLIPITMCWWVDEHTLPTNSYRPNQWQMPNQCRRVVSTTFLSAQKEGLLSMVIPAISTHTCICVLCASAAWHSESWSDTSWGWLLSHISGCPMKMSWAQDGAIWKRRYTRPQDQTEHHDTSPGAMSMYARVNVWSCSEASKLHVQMNPHRQDEANI